MKLEPLYEKALGSENLTTDQAEELYTRAPLGKLAAVAHQLRIEAAPAETVTWQIDRNVNITNACVSGCKFCNFHCKPSEKEKIFITTIEEYSRKIEETLALGGDQLLLQGGLHPGLDIDYYETLFRELKSRFPQVKLHALGPPEIFHIARIGKISIEETLRRLVAAGLDSLPGAGAEILDTEVRRRISPGKCTAEQWLDVMRTAHRMNLATSATMMYGHVETPRQRIEHLLRIRDLQAERPAGHHGFIAFIPWIFRGAGSRLESEGPISKYSPLDYLRLIAISRIVLHNIANIQASWLTVGKETALIALHCGANDMGSIMIEENVVRSGGARHRFDARGIRQAIREAGFSPELRDQLYRRREWNEKQPIGI
ncbi:MAG: dehypoxanthine futalosine cyclase [Rikenellaceae bacterium]|nr:dehypoxanthine futalosine cyclase [Rikenellaceae bacterium]